jgi:hypothetical protein
VHRTLGAGKYNCATLRLLLELRHSAQQQQAHLLGQQQFRHHLLRSYLLLLLCSGRGTSSGRGWLADATGSILAWLVWVVFLHGCVLLENMSAMIPSENVARHMLSRCAVHQVLSAQAFAAFLASTCRRTQQTLRQSSISAPVRHTWICASASRTIVACWTGSDIFKLYTIGAQLTPSTMHSVWIEQLACRLFMHKIYEQRSNSAVCVVYTTV